MLPAIQCAQNSTEKIIVTEKEIKKTNKDGMDNKVGTITNRVTAMMEIQSHFEKDSKEYKELEYRIACGQLYQQDELDRIKGIIARPMPAYWYAIKACGDDKFLQSICIDKKPYFMTYVYDDYRRKYNNYKKNSARNCMIEFGCSIQELIENNNRTKEQDDFLEWLYKKAPFGTGDCAMNKICCYIEEQFKEYKINLKNEHNFDYTYLKVKRRCTEEHRTQLLELHDKYVAMMKENINKDTKLVRTKHKGQGKDVNISRIINIDKNIREKAAEICPNDQERMNIILDICYGGQNNKRFCYVTIGDLIVSRLEELNESI